ncbi:MAG: RdgB/HAM1 family non-canonical purine NTP pyrophosphatase [Bdellovibrionota bacterium]
MPYIDKPRPVFLASNNQHKIAEMQQLAGSICKIKKLSTLSNNIQWVESGQSFFENALIKAIEVRKFTSEAVLADDSGLEVFTLNNAPGIFSSRYAGTEGDDEQNNIKLLNELAKISEPDRRAAFVCCLVFISENGTRSVFEGRCQGTIALHPKGKDGFGYDPIFIPDGYHQTMAELGNEVKNQISHRYHATRLWVEALTQNKV